VSTSDTISQSKDVGLTHAQELSEGAQQRAGDVAGHASEAAHQVVGTAAEQAHNVQAETVRQVRNLTGEATEQLTSQAKEQSRRLTTTLRGIAEELKGMAASGHPGSTATELVHQASERVSGFAGYLDGKEPAEVLDDVRRYARRRPGAFLAGAAVLGLLAGRVGRGVKDADADNHGAPAPNGFAPAAPAELPPSETQTPAVVRLDDSAPNGFTSSTTRFAGEDPATGALVPEGSRYSDGGY
jgi:hypothetical protein